jgi:cytochrome c-type biogenesis protein
LDERLPPLTIGMTTILLAALAAGMVSTVNPCGFAMLPAYLGYFLGETGGRGVRRVGGVAASVAAGFLAVFSIAGVVISVGMRALVDALPWLALVVGVGLVVAGSAQILGRRIVPYLRGPARVRKSQTPAGMFLFGVSYAVASLSCTLPIFLSLVTGAIASGSTLQAVATFVAYGSGMALVVVALTVAVAAGRRTIIDRIRPLAARLDQVSGWIMVSSGGFIVWYWATVLVAGSSALGRMPIVRAIDEWSSATTRFIGERPLVIGAAVVVVVAVERVLARAARR